MEDIRIYRIVWKNLLAAIACLTLTAVSIVDSINRNGGPPETPPVRPPF